MKIERYKNSMVQSLIRLISIPSIIDQSTSAYGKPFGEAINQCLDESLSICMTLGFKTYKDPEGYYGYAEIGQGDDYIAILCHLDVVPIGEESLWNIPPFQGTVIGDTIYGRGAGDDKGGTIVSIFALKALIDENITLNKRIRIIFGTDEETLWRDMDVYNQKEQAPWCALVPDGTFPFSYAEKGILQLELIRETKKDDPIINGGQNFNSVAMDVYYKGPHIKSIIKKINTEDIQYVETYEYLKVIGKSSHAAVPYKGKNAILYLALLLKEMGVKSDLIDFFTENLNYDYEKNVIFDEVIQDNSGQLTINLGKIEMNENQTKISLDLRIPVTFTKEAILNQLIKKVKHYGFTIHVYSYLPPLYAPLDSKFSQILLESYQKITNDYETQPFSSGGGTFARVFKQNAVCFGPNLIGFKTFIHQVNEQMNINCLMKALEIYYHTLKALLKTEKL